MFQQVLHCPIHRVIHCRIRQQHRAIVKKRTIVVCPVRIHQDRNIMCMPVLVEKKGVQCQHFTDIRPKAFQACNPDCLLYEKPDSVFDLFNLINAFIQALTIKALEQTLQCNKLPALEISRVV